MAESHKTDQSSEELENLSPEELQERIQEDKKSAKRSLRFAFTALIAIIAVCIAWFAANFRVTMTGTPISAESDEPFDLASVGQRQKGEENYLKDTNGNNILSAGSTRKSKEYIDIETGTTVTTTNERTYYTGGSGVAWHMSGEQSMVPGAGGKLEFYLIPKKENLGEAQISLQLEGYKFDEATQKAVKLENTKIQSLLNGHILFFRYLDDTYGYRGWSGQNQTFTIQAPERTINNGETETTVREFQKGKIYKVTLYWTWPQYFRNYIYTQRSTYGDLFTDKIDLEKNEDYTSLIKFVNDQKSVSSSKSCLFYDENTTTVDISGAINNTMQDDVLNLCNKYYNQADEYIGKNTQYVYIQINVK